MTLALIPAGGKSTRMGRPKLALPLGGKTVLECVLAALRAAGVDPILVVLTPPVAELAAPAQASGANTCLLPHQTADMRATVEAGLRWLEGRFAPRAEDDWLLVPADHPTLDSDVVRQLIAARAVHPDCSIFIPTFQGRRGHPTLFAWKHVADIRDLPAGEGANALIRRRPDQVLEVPVGSPHILDDLDTPDDYERLLRTPVK